MHLEARKVVVLGVLLALSSGCSERDRLTFPSSVDGQGPAVLIFGPGQADTVPQGPAALINGRVVDQDGIDTVYFDVQGGITTFNPFIAQGVDTVTFQLPITTTGLAGTTITVAISGVNIAGVHGDTAFRQITVQ